ncbi:enoyl-CoA hydratase/isomerase family protein [Rhodobacteraceae bacterium F11138]|nr:enoyl-CoA hydratase/isomerase family protein [Rhodobacteraceae bacterium F11138]
MDDINIRITGRAGRITLTRPHALNALSYDMCKAIDTILRLWREEEHVSLVVIDAEGDKAFCAGGDIAELYSTGTAGDFDYGRSFWRDEYRMNAMIADYPKPVVSFLQGFTMGGGVGLGCHGSHRVVDADSRIAMPECGIGLVPDVGGCYLLARAPGHLGAYLGTTGARMDAGDAIHAGFADHYIPRAQWSVLIELLETSGDVAHVAQYAQQPPQPGLAPHHAAIDDVFACSGLPGILAALRTDDSDFAHDTLRAMGRNAPLSMACTLQAIARLRAADPLRIQTALELEYRYTFRAMEHSDFLEGIRAAIIDKDRNPQWQYTGQDVPEAAIEQMLAPLGADTLTFDQ